ncbi:PAS domain-containing protein [Rhizobium laguerreae]|uniref:PAS domain-containing protein n=1 Tax=Rhizobium laguerreae TaxID=1076926 RepID=UPI001C90A408|nr:PAS domain-containing protein [Rhizobium laguerreae]MBY3155545.1 PAS domain-containing protein [Rhizobium laguerreae]
MADIRFDETKEMIRYWASLGSGPHAPLRADVSPRAIARFLPRVFIISKEDGVWKFRLAGTEFYPLYGHELTGQSFSAIWGGDFAAVAAGLDAAASAGLPLVVSSDAWSMEGVVEAETVILPLRASDGHGEVDRFIGLQTFPAAPPWWLASRPVLQASVKTTAIVGEGERALLAQARGKTVPAIKFVERPRAFLRVVETRLTA